MPGPLSLPRVFRIHVPEESAVCETVELSVHRDGPAMHWRAQGVRRSRQEAKSESVLTELKI